MCAFKAPKIPKTPKPAMMQEMQLPKDMERRRGDRFKRRGMWASVFTGPQGIGGPPSVTGSGGGMFGG